MPAYIFKLLTIFCCLLQPAFGATVSQSAMTTGSLSDQLNSISNDIKTRLGRFKI